MWVSEASILRCQSGTSCLFCNSSNAAERHILKQDYMAYVNLHGKRFDRRIYVHILLLSMA